MTCRHPRLPPLTPSSSVSMIPIMISRFTLALKKVFGEDQNGNGDIFTTGPFVARAPTLADTLDDTIQHSPDTAAAPT